MNIKSYALSIMKDEKRSIDRYLAGAILSMASWIYLVLVKGAHFLYSHNILRSRKVGAKVISIGNITLGGTGKTPFAIKLAKNIKAKGKSPAVLIRGYGGDEPDVLKERLGNIPVLIGRDRVKNAEMARSKLGSDCIILDDGFQHFRIKRDLDIVLIDATSPFGNLKLFPRGILREPLARLADADVAILTKSDMGRGNIDYIRDTLRRFNRRIDIAESFYQPLGLKKLFSEDVVQLAHIKNKKIALLAGIANPDYFEWMVSNLGAEVRLRFYYPDHYPYGKKDIACVVEKSLREDIKILITTEKDAVRLKRIKHQLKNILRKIEIFVLKIDFRISSNEKGIDNRIYSLLHS